MAAPVFAGLGTSSATSSGSSQNVAYPASIASGDLLLLIVSGARSSVNDVGPPGALTPTGFTSLSDQYYYWSTSNLNARGLLQIFYRVADGTETGNLAVSIFGHVGTSTVCQMRIGRITGADTTAPIEDWASYGHTNALGTSTISYPAVTITTATDRLLVAISAAADDSPLHAAPTGSPGASAYSATNAGALGTTTGSDTQIGVWWRDSGLSATNFTASGTGSAADGMGAFHLLIKPASSLTHSSLDCQPGSLAVTGTAASPVSARLIDAASGSMALTGFDTSLGKGYVFNAETGNYVLTGTSMTPLADRMLNAAPGSMALTGVLAGIGRDLSLQADPGSYALTGLLASPLADRAIAADSGVFTLTGSSGGLLADRLLSVDSGSFAVTGAAASPLAGRVLAGDPGAYALTGTLTSLIAGRTIAADPGSYVLAGELAELLFGGAANNYELDANPGSYALTGTAALVLAGRMLSGDPGSYAHAGVLTGLVATRVLAADPGVYAVTGALASVLADRVISATPGSYVLTGAEIETVVERAIAALAGSYTVTGRATVLEGSGAVPAEARVRTILMSRFGIY